jgi:hypothetical protein
MNDITNANATNDIVQDCGNCDRIILLPAWANDEANARIYGKRINGYCRTCVRHFVQNEIEDGVRNPDGTRK